MSDDLEKLGGSEQTKKDVKIADLETELSNEKDARKEERFAWCVILLGFVDVLLLGEMSNIVAPIVILVLQLIALLVFAKHSGIEYVAEHIDRLIGSVTRRIGKDG